MKSNKLEALVRKEADSFIKGYKGKIGVILEGSLLSLLGLSKDYGGKYSIDHCNGRNSILTDAFQRYAIEEAEKIAKNYKPSKEDLVGFTQAFEREFKNQFSYVIRDLAKKKAEEIAKEGLAKINIEIDSLLGDNV